MTREGHGRPNQGMPTVVKVQRGAPLSSRSAWSGASAAVVEEGASPVVGPDTRVHDPLALAEIELYGELGLSAEDLVALRGAGVL